VSGTEVLQACAIFDAYECCQLVVLLLALPHLLEKFRQVYHLGLGIKRAAEEVADLDLQDLKKLSLLLGAVLRAPQEPSEVASDPAMSEANREKGLDYE